MMRTTRDVARRLTISQLGTDWPGQQSITLGPYAKLTIFILADSPNKRLLFNDLPCDVIDIIRIIFINFF